MRAVVQLGPVPPPAGGIASAVADLRSALVRRGFAVRVLDPARGKGRLLAGLVRAGGEGAIVHVHVCGHNLGSYALAGVARAAAPGARLVITIHSGLAPVFLARLASPARGLARAALMSADAVVGVSAANAAAVVALGVLPTRVRVASPFIAEALAPAALPAAFPAAARPVVAAMVAPEPLYGGAVLAEGFAALAADLPSARLVLFGPGGADRALEAALAARGLAPAVVALGELPRPGALAVVRSADLFVRPTLADGDSVSVREALALSCRVVASDAAVRPAGVTLFRAGDGAALARAMRAALDGPAPAPAPPADDGLAPVLDLYAELGAEGASSLAGAPAASCPGAAGP